ncbi:cobalt ECF transporter T component CbiQ [Clostridium perfringens]|uniref:cobalt ECF transporter T component CbiQ n=1 Tax=Clostridium perfringens TaxID=1502 RepID=UPI0024BD57D6|nr:cobalt ECF transporter T component CbiQ [Clostridium perfringens]MDK0539242.1 cobalt ECF transporter T component CbiQ [Clostridium perfringens]MDM0455535.1 cobalt ECF transporter T component CbiQ [Clostridium perfringens]
MINIDKYAYSSKLKNINPAEKMFFALITLCVCLWANNFIVSMLVISIMTFLITKVGRTKIGVFIKLMMVPIAFLIIGILTIVVSYSLKQEAFLVSFKLFNGWIGVSKSGIIQGLNMFLKVMGSLSCLYFISLTTPMIDVISVLAKLKVPSFLIELISLVYRFIFIILETSEMMFISQNSRLGYRDIKTSYKSLGALASTLFIRSFKRANDLYTALEARGYNGELKVLEEQVQKRNYIYIITIIINLIFIGITIFIK